MLEGIASSDDSARSRKAMSKPTGEAKLARVMHQAFIKSKASKALHRYEFEGVKGSVTIVNPKTEKKTKANALFWYSNKIPKITLILGGTLKVVSFKGRLDKDGLYTKFSVLSSKLKDEDLLSFLKTK